MIWLLLILLAILVTTELFFLFEKQLFRSYIWLSNKSYQRRTGINPNDYPDSFTK